MKRTCMDCGAVIERCNGFVLAGDHLLFMEGKISYVRERCGRCVELQVLDNELETLKEIEC